MGRAVGRGPEGSPCKASQSWKSLEGSWYKPLCLGPGVIPTVYASLVLDNGLRFPLRKIRDWPKCSFIPVQA